MTVLASSIGGFVVSLFGVSVCFIVDSLTYFGSFALILLLHRYSVKTGIAGKESLLEDKDLSEVSLERSLHSEISEKYPSFWN